MTALHEPMSDTGEQQFGAVLDLPAVALPEGLAVIDLGEVPPVEEEDPEPVADKREAAVEGWGTLHVRVRDGLGRDDPLPPGRHRSKDATPAPWRWRLRRPRHRARRWSRRWSR